MIQMTWATPPREILQARLETMKAFFSHLGPQFPRDVQHAIDVLEYSIGVIDGADDSIRGARG